MFLNNHTDFILTPISENLRHVVSASSSINQGIESYALCDYIMQSVFLKMTGFQEQKLKCIKWELANHDYSYRYDQISSGYIAEGLSKYKEKNKLYKSLVSKIIEKEGHLPLIFTNRGKRNRFIESINSQLEDIFKDSVLSKWRQKSFIEYGEIWSQMNYKQLLTNKDELLASASNNGEDENLSIREIYENYLYKHRNRTAHNTFSYQQNLPTLRTLAHKDYFYNNYFLYFAILMLIDQVFVKLYKLFVEANENY